MSKRTILFLSGGRHGLHLMAEALASDLAPTTVTAFGAGMAPYPAHPQAVEVMAEIGKDLKRIPLRTPEDFDLFAFDLVITLGDLDPGCPPDLPPMPLNLQWQLLEPPDNREEEIREALRRVRDQLRARLSGLFTTGVLDALFASRRSLRAILDNLLDGVMAHTSSRRIFYLNHAAERIIGIPRNEVLGHDCHEVFPGRFCGGDCLFCEGAEATDKADTRKELTYPRPDGEELSLEMATVPLIDEERTVFGALISFRDITELVSLKRRLRHRHSLGGIVGKDPKMLRLFEQIREVSAVNVPVLLQGESGTGKELVANAIHELSARCEHPLVAVNCGALPEGILESEMFGHVRGAFSGAVRNKKGRFELADGGTLFLDEVAELSPALQVKLLRVLQEQVFYRVGGESAVKVDVRIISATNQDLRRLVDRGRFRRDLFYRLCVVPIELPPLRERRLDIPMLTEHFSEQIGRERGRPLIAPSTAALDLLTSYEWPGNVRELRNAIEYAYVKCHGDEFGPEQLPPELKSCRSVPPARPGPARRHSRAAVLEALAKSGGNRQGAAKALGVGRATLYRYLREYGIS